MAISVFVYVCNTYRQKDGYEPQQVQYCGQMFRAGHTYLEEWAILDVHHYWL
jgi:hypothetical protein